MAGTDPITPTDGEDGFTALCPVAEPVSVGAPPLTPGLVGDITLGQNVIEKRVVAGYTLSRPRALVQRRRMNVAWTNITGSQRNTMLAWIVGDLRGTLNAFSLAIDGAGESSIKVRFTDQGVSESHIDQGGGVHVYTISGEVEEVY